MIKVQITLVASPRNHLYRTSHPLVKYASLLFAFVHAHFDHVGDFAHNLHLKTGLCGSDDHAFEEATRNLKSPHAESQGRSMRVGAARPFSGRFAPDFG